MVDTLLALQESVALSAAESGTFAVQSPQTPGVLHVPTSYTTPAGPQSLPTAAGAQPPAAASVNASTGAAAGTASSVFYTRTGSHSRRNPVTNRMECGICFEPMGSTDRPMASPQCGHVYCMPCIQQILAGNGLCPVCRKKLEGVTRLYV